MNEQIVLDPTSERAPQSRPRVPRPATLREKTVALLDISKSRGDVFLDRLAERLTMRGLRIERFRKPTFAKVAPADLRYEISVRCDAVVEALAD